MDLRSCVSGSPISLVEIILNYLKREMKQRTRLVHGTQEEKEEEEEEFG